MSERERPTPTRPARTFEGRPLPRADEDLEDQGLAFDLGTLVSRRQALGAISFGLAGFGLAACGGGSSGSSTATTSSGASSSGEIPDETAGPYPGDGSNGVNVLDQSGIVRSDIRSSFGEYSGTAHGVPMDLELTITDLANDGAPFTGAAVYVWHCDREGRYSLYSEGATNQNYLRGVQIADSKGKVSFKSIYPACYSGRWPHIHFEVYPNRSGITDASNAIATSQIALPAAVNKKVYATPGYEDSVTNMAQLSLATDGIFGDDGGKSQLATVTGNVNLGLNVSLTAGVDTRTEPTGGGMSFGDGAPPGGGAPPSGAMPPSGGTPPAPPS